MAETYRIKLYDSGPWVGCENTNTELLADYGYSDEEWDELTPIEQESLLGEWAEDSFWNAGYEYYGEVIK